MNETPVLRDTSSRAVGLSPRVIEAHGVAIPVIEARSQTQAERGLQAANPILIAGGWSTDEKTYAGLQEALARSGRMVVTLGHPRRGGTYPTERSEQTVGIPDVEWMKAQNILGYVGNEQTQEHISAEGVSRKFDVFAHSEGAINALMAACENPEKFGNIVLFGPGGLQGKDAVLKLIMRFGGKMVTEQIDAKRPRATMLRDRYDRQRRRAHLGPSDADTPGGVGASWSEPAAVQKQLQEGMSPLSKYFLANVQRAIREGRAIAETDILAMLEYVRSQGVKIVVMQGVDDKAIPVKKVSAHLAQGMDTDRAGLNKFIDGVVTVPMLHDDPIQHPDAVAPAVAAILDTLNNPPEIQR